MIQSAIAVSEQALCDSVKNRDFVAFKTWYGDCEFMTRQELEYLYIEFLNACSSYHKDYVQPSEIFWAGVQRLLAIALRHGATSKEEIDWSQAYTGEKP